MPARPMALGKKDMQNAQLGTCYMANMYAFRIYELEPGTPWIALLHTQSEK